MANLILMRHGASAWNTRNLFTGWVDVPLSAQGIDEAMVAGAQLASCPIDVIYCSGLSRSIMTAMIAMSRHHSGRVPIIKHPDSELKGQKGKIQGSLLDTIPTFFADELNERQYGDLQGMNKDECRKKFGVEQVEIWRRSYSMAPPNGESLKMTAERTLPYFEKEILPRLKKGENVLICAHGNSLRSIIMSLKKLSEEQVVSLELATGIPIIYRYQKNKFHEIDHLP